MNKTKIEWVKNPDDTQGYTWNPITGCLNGCEYCYARKLANGRLRRLYLWNPHTIPEPGFNRLDPFYPRFWEDRLDDIIRGYHRADFVGGNVPFAAKPRGIFVCDMSDLFGIGIPEEWTRRVLKKINDWDNRYDRFYLLTKQPQNLIKFSPFPDNCWVGVTATDYDSFYRGAVYYLPKIQAKIKYISFEPLLGWSKHIRGWLTACFIDAGINWLIIGAQTKPYKPPKIEWLQEIVEGTDKAGIPVFLKDNLKPLLIDDKGYPHAGVELLDRVIENGIWKLRQEFPNV